MNATPDDSPSLIPALPGYRSVSPEELQLIGAIKAHEQETLRLLHDVRAHLAKQDGAARRSVEPGMTHAGFAEAERELARLIDAEPLRWHSIARTELQQGFMALVRAVAQPRTQA
jgi:hypothetical protein